jgi:hypothetical protein
MKVKDLIKELEKFDPEYVVLMSKDDEGNAYRHVGDLELFQVYENDGYDTYRRDVPDDVLDDVVIMMWPGW